jgi:hypothetical protein
MDLHSTIAKDAIKAKLWKMVKSLHNVWLHHNKHIWLAHHLSSHQYILAAIALKFQHVVGLYVKIAQALKYCQAIKANKQIDPAFIRKPTEGPGISSA